MAGPNGRCRMHNGGAKRGKAHHRFKHGRDTAVAIEGAERAKTARAAAARSLAKITGAAVVLHDLVESGSLAPELAREKLESVTEQRTEEARRLFDEADEGDNAALDAFHPGALKRRYAMSRARSVASRAKAAKRKAAKLAKEPEKS